MDEIVLKDNMEDALTLPKESSVNKTYSDEALRKQKAVTLLAGSAVIGVNPKIIVILSTISLLITLIRIRF